MKFITFFVALFVLISSSVFCMTNTSFYNSQLIDAAFYEDLEQARHALVKGAEVNTKTEQLDTPLHIATLKGSAKMVNLLLNLRADKESKDEFLKTPLHIAAEHGHIKIVKLLLNFKAQTDAKDHNLWTPLHMAVFYGHTEVVKLLLAAGVDKEATVLFNLTALHLSLLTKNHNEINQLLLAANFDPNALTEKQDTPLHLASKNNCSSVIAMLLQKGALINAQNQNGETSLMIACRSDNYEKVKTLTKKYDIDVTLKNNDGKTALDIAKTEMKQGKLSTFNIFGKNNKQKILKLLLIKEKAENLKSQLFNAIEQKDFAQVKQLIKKMTFYVYDKKGNNPLHYGVISGNSQIVTLILSCIPNLSQLPNKEGKTPIDYAMGNMMQQFLNLRSKSKVQADSSIFTSSCIIA